MAAGEYVSIICNAADCVTHEPVVIENGTDIDIVLESMARIDKMCIRDRYSNKP